MRSLPSLTSVLTVLSLGLFSLPTLAEQTETFRFTAIPDEDESRLVERFSRVADYLSETLEVEVEYVPVKSYGAAVTAFRNDQVQLAWFGGLTGVQARAAVEGANALANDEDTDTIPHNFMMRRAEYGRIDEQSQCLGAHTR